MQGEFSEPVDVQNASVQSTIATETSGLQRSTGRQVEWGIKAAGQHKCIVLDTSPYGPDRRSAVNLTEATIWQGLYKVVCWEHA